MNDELNLEISDVLVSLNNIGIDDFFSLVTPFTLIYINKRRVAKQKTKLKRDFKITEAFNLELPKDFLTEEEVLDLERIQKSEFSELILNFIDRLTNEFSEENLVFLKRNFSSLEVVKQGFKLENKILGGNVQGRYDLSKNKIKIPKNFEDVYVYHELMHAASSFCETDGIFIFSGFKQASNKIDHWIGEALNEGYTQLLTEEIFFNSMNFVKIYPYEKRIAHIIEDVVGKRMRDYYFNANLNGLIEELSFYTSREEVLVFLQKFDFFSQKLYVDVLNKEVIEVLQQCYKDINLFLISIYLKKVSLNLIENEDVKEQMTSAYAKIMSEIPAKITSKNVCFETNIGDYLSTFFEIANSAAKSQEIKKV